MYFKAPVFQRLFLQVYFYTSEIFSCLKTSVSVCRYIGGGGKKCLYCENSNPKNNFFRNFFSNFLAI